MDAPRILIADDDVQFLRACSRALKRSGFAVIPVEDGYQAVDQAVRHEPELFVLDVHMPAGDGFSVHSRLMNHPTLSITPVIFMTHDDSEDIARLAVDHEAMAILYKPFDVEQLLMAVRSALSGTGRDLAA